jgi:hypothetical protein
MFPVSGKQLVVRLPSMII